VPEWSADVEVDAALVRRLVGDQFPELELRSLRPLAEGWDNAVWVVDERWAFRFPRREIAIPGFVRELAVLPRLAPLLPLPIPTPVFRGVPAAGYPWPFFGAPLLPGDELPDANLDDAGRIALARPLAGFLRALHHPATAAAVEPLPADPWGRADMARRVPRALECLDELRGLGLWRASPSVLRLLESARRLPQPPASVLVHGDLHTRHVLVDDPGAITGMIDHPSRSGPRTAPSITGIIDHPSRSGPRTAPSITGIIDWGDVCAGDPSVDMSLYWSLLPPDGRREFLAEYGPLNEEQLLRARVLTLFLCAMLAVYADREGMKAVRREALEGLRRAVVD
jgi:aminoglycoside phosphotransferase (APT) family kinase protein